MGFGSQDLTPEKKREYIEQHIPYRMVAVARVLQMRGWSEITRQWSFQPPWMYSPIFMGEVMNAAIEHGLISSRALLNFLGFVSSDGVPISKKTKKDHPNDFTLRTLCGTYLTETDIESIYGPETSDVLEHCGRIIGVADKAVAHLTFSELPPWSDSFDVCGKAIFRLLRHRVNPMLANSAELGGLTIADRFFYGIA